ncbi:MAG: hypothetical protein Q9184_005651 [Pyrenodesmia sp. 2 TL-2023]
MPKPQERRDSMSQLYDKDYQKYLQSDFVGESVSKALWSITPAKVLDTVEKVKEAVTYAEYRVKHRKVTPRTKAFLEHYQTTLAALLDDKCPRREGQVEALNDFFHSKAILHTELQPEQQVEMSAVAQLARLRYYADYGDYAAAECLHFREKCGEKNVEGLEQLTGRNWSEVEAELKAEDEEYQKWLAKGPRGQSPPTPMTTIISAACGKLHIDRHTVRYSIKFYAARNANAHSGVSTYIKNLKWKKLGSQLWKDLRQIPCILGKADQASMRKTIETIRDRYFLEIAEFPEDQLVNRYALQLTKERQQKEEDETERKIEEKERLKEKAEKDAENQASWDLRKAREFQVRNSGEKRRERASQPQYR